MDQRLQELKDKTAKVLTSKTMEQKQEEDGYQQVLQKVEKKPK